MHPLLPGIWNISLGTVITYSGSTFLCAFLCSLQNVHSYETHQGLNTKVFFLKQNVL